MLQPVIAGLAQAVRNNRLVEPLPYHNGPQTTSFTQEGHSDKILYKLQSLQRPETTTILRERI
jgi:hypothetical protein